MGSQQCADSPFQGVPSTPLLRSNQSPLAAVVPVNSQSSTPGGSPFRPFSQRHHNEAKRQSATPFLSGHLAECENMPPVLFKTPQMTASQDCRDPVVPDQITSAVGIHRDVDKVVPAGSSIDILDMIDNQQIAAAAAAVVVSCDFSRSSTENNEAVVELASLGDDVSASGSHDDFDCLFADCNDIFM